MEGYEYAYRIKMLYNLRKRKPVTKQLYKLSNVKFTSIKDMRHKIAMELKEEIGDIGYYDGRHSTKRWLLEDEDVSQMYAIYRRGETFLWCEMGDEVREVPKKEKKRKKKRKGKKKMFA